MEGKGGKKGFAVMSGVNLCVKSYAVLQDSAGKILVRGTPFEADGEPLSRDGAVYGWLIKLDGETFFVKSCDVATDDEEWP
jgi:hypothetical protein